MGSLRGDLLLNIRVFVSVISQERLDVGKAVVQGRMLSTTLIDVPWELRELSSGDFSVVVGLGFAWALQEFNACSRTV